MNFFRFLKTRAAEAGVGVSDLALLRTAPPLTDSIYGPAYNVRRQLITQSPAAVKLGQTVVPVSLLGDGLYFHGGTLLSPLAREKE